MLFGEVRPAPVAAVAPPSAAPAERYPSRPWDRFALARPSGELLLFAGLRISRALGEGLPGWNGTHLPPAVAQALAGAPCTPVGGQGLLPPAAGALRPLVAVSLASPSTNRRYLRRKAPPCSTPRAARTGHRGHAGPHPRRCAPCTAYAALGVSNKLELVARCATSSARLRGAAGGPCDCSVVSAPSAFAEAATAPPFPVVRTGSRHRCGPPSPGLDS